MLIERIPIESMSSFSPSRWNQSTTRPSRYPSNGLSCANEYAPGISKVIPDNFRMFPGLFLYVGKWEGTAINSLSEIDDVFAPRLHHSNSAIVMVQHERVECVRICPELHVNIEQSDYRAVAIANRYSMGTAFWPSSKYCSIVSIISPRSAGYSASSMASSAAMNNPDSVRACSQ